MLNALLVQTLPCRVVSLSLGLVGRNQRVAFTAGVVVRARVDYDGTVFLRELSSWCVVASLSSLLFNNRRERVILSGARDSALCEGPAFRRGRACGAKSPP